RGASTSQLPRGQEFFRGRRVANGRCRARSVVRSGEGVEPPLDQLEDHDVDRCEVLELDAEVGAANGGGGLVADVAEEVEAFGGFAAELEHDLDLALER